MNLEQDVRYYDSLDTIILNSVADVETIMKWKDLNKDLVRNYNPVLSEGLIRFEKLMQIYFKQDGDFVHYKVADKTGRLLTFNTKKTYNGMGGVTVSDIVNRGFDKIKIVNEDGMIKDTITTHTALMAYMEHYTEYVVETKVRSAITKKAKHGKKVNRVVRIGKKIYNVNVPRETLKEAKEKQKHVESFTVCGHWRKTKSGRTWVKGYIKGDKSKLPAPKTYKV